MALTKLTYCQFRQLKKIQFVLKKPFSGNSEEELNKFLHVNMPAVISKLQKYSSDLATPKQLKYIQAIERFVGEKFTGKTKYEASEYISFWNNCIYYRQSPSKYIRNRIKDYLHQSSVTPPKQTVSLETVAKQGDKEAQYMLACYYEENDEIKKAEKWYMSAAEQGFPDAQYSLADLYESKYHDNVKAAKWYRLAASQGIAEAQCKLASFYELGEGGLEINENEALKLYQLAAEQGLGEAQCSLGIFYEEGLGGLATNMEKAAAWYQLAAPQSIIEAQYRLGKMFKEGIGVPKNSEEAKKWLTEAARRGYIDAKAELISLQRQSFGIR